MVPWDWFRRVRVHPNATLLQVGFANHLLLGHEIPAARYGMDLHAAAIIESRTHHHLHAIVGEPGPGVQIANQAFSAILLPDPPDGPTVVHHLQWSRRKLIPGGFVIVSIPWELLAFTLTVLSGSFNLPYAESVHGHIVLVAERPVHAPTPLPPAEQRAIGDRLMRPPVGPPPWPTHLLIPAAPKTAITPFQSGFLSREEIPSYLAADSLQDTVLAQVYQRQRALAETPPMPLKIGHVALQLATGHFNGMMGTGDTRHVVKGQVIRHTLETQSISADQTVVEHQQDQLAVRISTLTPDGTLRYFGEAPSPAHRSEDAEEDA